MGFSCEQNQREVKLNLGCGAEVKKEYISIDIDYELTKYWDDILIADIKQLPFGKSTVDVAYCSHILEHFEYSELTLVLNEINRVLKIGGLFVSYTPYIPVVAIQLARATDTQRCVEISNTIYGQNALARGIHRIAIQPVIIETLLPNFSFHIMQINDTILHCEGIKEYD